MKNPLSKHRLKNLVKTKVTDYWYHLLTAEASPMPSISHFNPGMHSLSEPHPLWYAAGSSTHEVNKSTILARMISGRYRTESLCRFWTKNREGICLANTCHQVVGSLEHLLLECPALSTARENLQQMWLARAAVLPPLLKIVLEVMKSSTKTQMSFILDPSSMQEISALFEEHGRVVLDIVFYMARTYAYGMHRKKFILIRKWPYSTRN